MNTAERRTLKMHPRLLWDVIHRQAGTLSKAILEGVMNSVDAGATRCDITLDRKQFSIIDDGRGFRNEDEITRFFETFGYPHKEGDAVYGRFRMGRGQIFSFGSSVWKTGNYVMQVDLKPQENAVGDEYALGYNFSIADESVTGCQIHVALYDTLKPSELDAQIREIRDYVKYVAIPVSLNGTVVSTHPSKDKWDVETDAYYIRKRTSGSLDVYNQGVLVTKMPSYRYGTGGVVVSKVPLEVNFARNDVQSSCKVFRKVINYLNDDTLEAAKRSTPLSESERENIARRITAGEIRLSDVQDARIVTDVTGSHHRFNVLLNLSRFNNSIAVAPRGDRVSEMAHTRKMAFVVTPETAGRFGANDVHELIKSIREIARANDVRSKLTLSPMTIEDFGKVISADYEPIQERELNAAERLALRAIRAGYDELMLKACVRSTLRDRYELFDYWTKRRRISVGDSDVAEAWTDGSQEIWINRKNLRLIKEGLPGMLRLASLLLHEQIHDRATAGSHEHGVEFYETFHNALVHSGVVMFSAQRMLKHCLKEMRDEKKRTITRTLLKDDDLITEAEDFGLVDKRQDVDEPRHFATGITP